MLLGRVQAITMLCKDRKNSSVVWNAQPIYVQHHGVHGHHHVQRRGSCKSAQWAVLPVRHMGFSGPASVAGVPGSCSSRAEAGVPPSPIAPGIAGSGAVGTCMPCQVDALGTHVVFAARVACHPAFIRSM